MNNVSITVASVPADKSRHISLQTAADPFLDQVIALLPALHAFGQSLYGDPARADDLLSPIECQLRPPEGQVALGALRGDTAVPLIVDASVPSDADA